MEQNNYKYVPCLRWKQGEYQAIFNLSDSTKDKILPLIEVPEIGFDFENEEEIKSLDEHVELFIKRVIKKWGNRPCFIDTCLIERSRKLNGNELPIEFIFTQLRQNGCNGIPVTSLSGSPVFLEQIRRISKLDSNGVCIRISIEELNDKGFTDKINGFLANLGLNPSECDFIFDLNAPNFVPIDGFAKLVFQNIKRIPYIAEWRTLILLGTSFPASMAEVKRGLSIVPRCEWILYKEVAGQLLKDRTRLPKFGDYVINHPDINQMDMRIVKPSASLRYTIDDNWLIIKGTNVREHGTKQYRDHCKGLIKSGFYSGNKFSMGDAYISDCSVGKKGTGNLTTWWMVGTNHHIETVIKDISNLHDLTSNS